MDDARGPVVLAGTEAHDTRWPAALFRSGDRDRSDAGTGVRPDAALDERLSSFLFLFCFRPILTDPGKTGLWRRSNYSEKQHIINGRPVPQIGVVPRSISFQTLKLSDQPVARSIPFKAETTGRAHTDAGLGLHLHGRSGSAIHPSGYAASQT